MIAKVTFYPIGNADTTLIKMERSGKTILWDYANMRDQNDPQDNRCDLPAELNKSITRDYYDVVSFTHADKDHYNGFSEYFYLEHAIKYQGVGRKKINELWVPAAVLLDTTLVDEAKILKTEAIHRLRNKRGIKIFARPKKMKEWCDNQENISYEEVKHLFVDAGTIVDGFDKHSDGIEFFVHSPFVSETKDIDRNCEAIIVQATFNDNNETKMLLGSDSTWEIWSDVVKITRHFGNDVRLVWDIFHISHHSSYTALSSEKEEDKTEPTDEIKWLFETQGQPRSRIISPSWPIPSKNSEADRDAQPPHRQAANYYREVADNKAGEFLVTMEFPNQSEPRPITIEIDEVFGPKVKKLTAGTAFVSEQKTERAG